MAAAGAGAEAAVSDTAESDEALMQRYQRGDRRAFRLIVARHQRPLFHFALRQLRDPETSEEVVQEAFVRLVQNARDFKHEARFTTWIYTIVRNLCIDQLRKRALRRHPSLDQARGGEEGGATLGDAIADTKADVERAASSVEMRTTIAEAVAALPEEQREVFLLRETAHMPFKEIAEITGVPENTVKSRMRYALERLQEALREYEEFARALR